MGSGRSRQRSSPTHSNDGARAATGGAARAAHTGGVARPRTSSALRLAEERHSCSRGGREPREVKASPRTSSTLRRARKSERCPRVPSRNCRQGGSCGCDLRRTALTSDGGGGGRGTGRPWHDRRVEEKVAAGGSSRRKLGVCGSKRSRAGGCGAWVRKKKGDGILVQEGIVVVRTHMRMAFQRSHFAAWQRGEAHF
jgi:hypothetical protein